MKDFSRVLLLTFVCGLLANCSAYRQMMGDSRTKISTHMQAMSNDNPKTVLTLPIGGQNMAFKKIPEFSHRSVAAFESFEAEDGQGYGLLLQLDMKGKSALETVSRLNTGEVLLTFVNGIPVDMVQIDSPISDGRFTIWRGISKETVDDLDKYYPRIKYLRSGARSMEMLPSTYLMKLRAREDAKKMEEAEKKAQRDKERGKLPTAPKTKEIPLEGFKAPGT